MGLDTSKWSALRDVVAAIVAERPDEYDAATRQNLDDLLNLLRSTNRPAPTVFPGYWPTFCLEWDEPEVTGVSIEVFEAHYEVYGLGPGPVDVRDHDHLPGDPIPRRPARRSPSAALIATPFSPCGRRCRPKGDG